MERPLQQRDPHSTASRDPRDGPRAGRTKGMTMRTIDNLLHNLGRFVFGMGLGVALTSTYVIVTGAPDLLAPMPAVEVVRLDPITVTISRERFDAIYAASEPATEAVHVYGRGPQRVG